MPKVPVRIPKLSIATHEATLVQWFVPEGQKVNEGEALYLVETEKVETEVDSPTTGIIHWTTELGGTHEVGAEIGYIDGSG